MIRYPLTGIFDPRVRREFDAAVLRLLPMCAVRVDIRRIYNTGLSNDELMRELDRRSPPSQRGKAVRKMHVVGVANMSAEGVEFLTDEFPSSDPTCC